MLEKIPDVNIISMEVTVGEDSFLYGPGGNLDIKQFYARQRSGQFASTSQINQETYRSAFEGALKDGQDVIYLGFTSGLSGSLDVARMCMDSIRPLNPDRKAICVDTLCAAVGEGFLVYEAALKQQQGMSIDELYKWVEENKLKVCHWFTVDTFDHLKHGGRVSAASAAVGSVLNIKPLLHVDNDGTLKVMKKPRGRRKAVAEQIACMTEGWRPDIGSLVLIGHGDDPEAAELLKEMVEQKFPQSEIHIGYIGPVIGAHTGPGMLALIYWGDNR